MTVQVHSRRALRGDNDETLCGAERSRRLADPPEMSSEQADVTCWRCIMLLLGRPLPTEPEMPEHKRLDAAKREGRDATQMLGEFLNEFLVEEGIHLARYNKHDELYEVSDKRALLAKFFGINENALESEKVALLEYQRKINAAMEWAQTEGRDALQRS